MEENIVAVEKPKKKVTKAQRKARNKANTKYNKLHTYKAYIRFYDKSDADIIDYIKSIDNKAGYIKNLIREDMKKQSEK